MIPSQLSRLVPVDVRSVWPMEATSFTPWLLANPQVLGEALGMDLLLEAAEHKVGGFSLDLIGRDQDTDERVIVENQFGATDHRHLGQLLTYAGGTDPATVVWIAESIRDEHRAALDWLNGRTDGDTRFFGVRLAAVTLEGAPAGLVAPLLEVVVKPNDWGKQVRATGAPSERERLYEEFWTRWLEQVAGRRWTNKAAPPRHWMYLPASSPKARYAVSFRNNGMLSELFFHHPDAAVNRARWEVLAGRRPEFEAAFGGPVVFNDLPTRKGCRIGVERSGGETVDDRASWADYRDWFEDTQRRLRAAVQAVGGIPPLPAGTPVPEDSDDPDE
jgi:hypothetical protein